MKEYMMTTGLNGWHRIGIIISVSWAIEAYFHIAGQEEEVAQHQRTAAVINGEHRQGGTFAECSKVGDDYVDPRMLLTREVAAGTALLPIPFAWASIYILLVLLRWVKRGFVQSVAS